MDTDSHGYPRNYYQSIPPPTNEDENSFDPSDFFLHSSLASAAVKVENDTNIETDINKDLQVSESDDSDEGEISRDVINEEDQSNDGFDFDEFLS